MLLPPFPAHTTQKQNYSLAGCDLLPRYTEMPRLRNIAGNTVGQSPTNLGTLGAFYWHHTKNDENEIQQTQAS